MPRRGLRRSPHPTSPSHPFITVTESPDTDQAQGCAPTVPFASTPPTANQQQQQKRRTGFVCPMLLHASCPCEPKAHKDKEACGSGCATRAWGPGVGWDVWDVQWGAARTSCARRVLRERLPGAAGTAYSPREDPVSARVRTCAGIPSYGCVRMVRVRAMRGRETRCAAPGQHHQRYRAPGVRPSTSCLAVRAQRPSSTTTWTTDSLMR